MTQYISLRLTAGQIRALRNIVEDHLISENETEAPGEIAAERILQKIDAAIAKKATA